MRSAVAAVVVGIAAGRYNCPGSGSFIRAWMEVTADANASCTSVQLEIEARTNGSWVDPHNGGIYTLLSSSNGVINTQRTTNPATAILGMEYTDRQTFELMPIDGGCQIKGCSESQGFSIGDVSTNYCDLRNLYCGSSDGCVAVNNDFTHQERSHEGSLGAGHDASKCIVAGANMIRSALVIMNMQVDYVREFVPGGDQVVPVINGMRDKYAFNEIIIHKEWHCANHISFASFHATRNKSQGDVLRLEYLPDGRICDDTVDGAYIDAYGINATRCAADAETVHFRQTLWVDHCVKHSAGANLLPALKVEPTDVEVREGYICHVDAPEEEDEEDKVGSTLKGTEFPPPSDLWAALRARSITDVYMSGIALAYLVKPSTEAVEHGFTTHVVRDAATTDDESLPKLLSKFQDRGIRVVESADLTVPRRELDAHHDVLV